MRRVNLCFISQTNYCRRLRQHRTRNEMNSQQLLVARIGWTNRQKAPKNLDQSIYIQSLIPNDLWSGAPRPKAGG
ncbi:hypothetical protein BS78_02G117700 [Paspalum vaginatum]|nr:hypothetical protein BS78_02G117700 [Paspalum vaginatum]